MQLISISDVAGDQILSLHAVFCMQQQRDSINYGADVRSLHEDKSGAVLGAVGSEENNYDV